MQFDDEPGEIAKDACATFCNHQKLALEQLKVCCAGAADGSNFLKRSTKFIHLLFTEIRERLSPVHTYTDSFENGDFFLLLYRWKYDSFFHRACVMLVVYDA